MRAAALRPPTIVLTKSTVRSVPGRDPGELIGETLLERYRVERLIGTGGMALVYAGRHTAIDRKVAIKVLRRRFADEPDTVARFLREARASSLVRHEHIVEVTDFGTTDDGLVFMVMEYLEGETLADLLSREGRMPWSRVHGIALQLCDALHAAHRAGIVHRDITLRNCVRIRRGSNREYIKLLDFGIAKLLGPMMIPGVAPSDPRRLTSDMDVFGTPEFMSPEQARRSMDADPRSDVYATGVLLYALLAGRLPFEAGSAAEVMARHIYDDVPPPSLHEPSLPSAVEAVILRALEKRPDRRFQSMAEFAAAIQAIPRDAIGDPTATAASSWSSSTLLGTTGLLQRSRTADRRRVWVGALAVTAALAFGVHGWLTADEAPAPAAASVLPAAMLPASGLSATSGPTDADVATPYLPSTAPRLRVRPRENAERLRSRR